MAAVKLCCNVPVGAWLYLIVHWVNLATDVSYYITVPWDDPYWQVSALIFLLITYGALAASIILCGLCGTCSK